MSTTTETTKKVKDLQVGDKVDLESCPHLHDHIQAEFEYAEVVEIVQETATCICVYYDIADPCACGYSPDQELKVLVED